MTPFSTAHRISIGLLEDDADFRTELSLALGGYGFDVRFAAADSANFLRDFGSTPTDIVILDANVPGEDGFAVATRLRAQHAVGIIMLTGRSALEDRVRALEGGADVYLTKPVDLLELSSVIRSLVRRMCLTGTQVQADALSEVSGAASARPSGTRAWTLEEGGWSVIDPSGRSLGLSAQERLFMTALINTRGDVVSRDALSLLFSPDSPNTFELRRIDVLVSRLRSKAQLLGIKLPVVSVRGQGYVFTG